MKKLIKKLFPGLVPVYNRLYNYVAHYRFKNVGIDEVFATIYKENHWGDGESKSGTGSNSRNAQSVVQIFSKIRSIYSVRTVLDIPCGDFNWMKHVDLTGMTYTGADIVQELIDNNNELYEGVNASFLKLDLVESELPRVDLIFCRDCLVHFSYKDIRRAIANVKLSGSELIAMTTFPNHENHDIITGDWRPLNFSLPPFDFPKPLYVESEDCMEDESGRYRDKSIALWRISDIPTF